jgi:hypothetical protein
MLTLSSSRPWFAGPLPVVTSPIGAATTDGFDPRLLAQLGRAAELTRDESERTLYRAGLIEIFRAGVQPPAGRESSGGCESEGRAREERP